MKFGFVLFYCLLRLKFSTFAVKIVCDSVVRRVKSGVGYVAGRGGWVVKVYFGLADGYFGVAECGGYVRDV